MKIEIAKCLKNKNSGFTLTELSVAIVIIGLIAAGVFSGQKLVNQAKLQNIIKEIREYDTAINNFKDKFKYYPGDFSSAFVYWSTACAATDVLCNGNGNWQITTGEDLQFWKQLSLSGFITGSYSGATAGTHVIGTNAPRSMFQGGGYQAGYITTGVTSYYATSGNFLEFGSMSGNTAGMIDGAILKPEDAFSIDTKIDDGVAYTGNLYTARGNGLTTCVSAAITAANATYTLTDNTPSCRIFWWLDKNK